MRTIKSTVSDLLNASAEAIPPFEPALRSMLANTLTPFVSFRNEQLHLVALPRLLTLESNCIDVGAHRGKFLHHILRHAPQGSHIGIEPLPEMYQKLARYYQRDIRISLQNVALSDHSGQAEFSHIRRDPGASSFRVGTDVPTSDIERLAVQVVTLDSLVPSGRKIDYLKIDVEGAELFVLRGARALLSRDRPYVVFEHQRGSIAPYEITSEPLYELLVREMGYSLFTIQGWLEGAKSLSQAQFDDEVALGVTVDFLADPGCRTPG